MDLKNVPAKKILPRFVLDLIGEFQQRGFEIYIVGGAVRDILMNKAVSDWDFTTNATPDQMLTFLSDAFYDNIFGTVGISHKDAAKPLEVTTFRSELGYSDRRRPDKIVWGTNLEEDLSRRDFTINAIALKAEASHQSLLTIIDPFHGQKDIQSETIRAVGDPNERFSEDALRMMRAIRIGSELGFVIEEHTFEAIKMNAHLIHHVSNERIRDELFKILASAFCYEGLVMLRNSGLLKEILPEVENAFYTPQKSPKRHHVLDVGSHMFYSLRYCPSRDPLVRFAALLHDVGKPETFHKDLQTKVITFHNHEVVGAKIARQIAQRLKLSKNQEEKLITLVRWHLFSVDERQTDSAIRRFIRNVGKENLDDILAVRVGDRLGGGATETSWRLELFKKRLEEVQKQPFSIADLKITGTDVMKELGISSGPKVGETLTTLFKEVDEGKLKNTREDLLKRMHDINHPTTN